MTNEELAGFSQIVILDHGSAVLGSFLERFGNQVGLSDVNFVMRGDTIIKRAYIVLAIRSLARSVVKRPRSHAARRQVRGIKNKPR